jgi:hypothetical protein
VRNTAKSALTRLQSQLALTCDGKEKNIVEEGAVVGEGKKRKSEIEEESERKKRRKSGSEGEEREVGLRGKGKRIFDESLYSEDESEEEKEVIFQTDRIVMSKVEKESEEEKDATFQYSCIETSKVDRESEEEKEVFFQTDLIKSELAQKCNPPPITSAPLDESTLCDLTDVTYEIEEEDEEVVFQLSLIQQKINGSS